MFRRLQRWMERHNRAALRRLAPKIKQAEPRTFPKQLPDDGTALHAIRMDARNFVTLDGPDAQMLEHALTTVEVEVELLNKELDYYYRSPTERTTVTKPTQPKDFAVPPGY